MSPYHFCRQFKKRVGTTPGGLPPGAGMTAGGSKPARVDRVCD